MRFLLSGIFVEGVGSFLDGLFGTGNGTTSTSVNVGVVGITKVCVRNLIRPIEGQHFASFPFLKAFWKKNCVICYNKVHLFLD